MKDIFVDSPFSGSLELFFLSPNFMKKCRNSPPKNQQIFRVPPVPMGFFISRPLWTTSSASNPTEVVFVACCRRRESLETKIPSFITNLTSTPLKSTPKIPKMATSHILKEWDTKISILHHFGVPETATPWVIKNSGIFQPRLQLQPKIPTSFLRQASQLQSWVSGGLRILRQWSFRDVQLPFDPPRNSAGEKMAEKSTVHIYRILETNSFL